MIPVNEPLLNGNEKKYLQECIDTGWISSEGPFVKKFEEQFSKRVGRKHGVSVCNGSIALDLAVYAIGIQKDDEVIMPSFTIISPAAAVVRCGAIPVFVDSDPETWNIDVKKIEEKITARTKAIIVVHIYGLPVDMDAVFDIAGRHNLAVVEDAAEMHGQNYKNSPCGSFGLVSIFSFYPNKHITTGEGGMIVTDDAFINERCLSLRNLAFLPERRFVHNELGWNYRFTNLQAAVGLAQLERLDEFIKRKRAMGELYTRLLKDLSDFIQLPTTRTEYAENIYWVYGVVLKEKYKGDAVAIMRKLGQYGIGTRPFFYPMHKQPVFQKMSWYKEEQFPVAENLGERGFYIPSGLSINEDQIKEVSDKLHEILNEKVQ